jgi:ferredoxin
MSHAGQTIEVFHERCMGAGNCADVAPKYFDQSDTDGTVVLRQEDVEDADRELVDQAIDICPVAALSLKAASAGVHA